uniref:Uncharacterized protein n=1 Tax=Anguilla anguilla TaxID=7936 RepID=A0A0E9UFP9_ANGAN
MSGPLKVQPGSHIRFSLRER